MKFIFHMMGFVFAGTLISGCDYLSERRFGNGPPSYDEYMKRQGSGIPKHSSEEMNQCPKPNGIFQNEAKEKGGVVLATYFSVPGFQLPANSYPSSWPKDKVVEIASSPIAILGGKKNGLRQVYLAPPSERFTLELRPLEFNKFRIGVKGTSGLSDEAEGYLILTGERQRCENGILKAFWRNYDKIVLGSELYVEPGTGDIVVRIPSGHYAGEWHNERFIRSKRIGN